MGTTVAGQLIRTVKDLCGYTNEIQAVEVIPIVAIPDEDALGCTVDWTR
jgi:hypothetical protein